MPDDTGPRPFIIEHRRRYEADNHHFAPDARLVVTPALRTAGLLGALPADLLCVLFSVLTRLSANGRAEATAWGVAEGLGIPESEARSRLLALQAVVWEGKPVLRCWQSGGELGVDRFYLSPHLHTTEDNDRPPDPYAAPAHAVAPDTSWRQAVYRHSRERYGRPRAEVEKIIREQLGHSDEPDDSTPEGQLARRLMAYGISMSEAERLVRTYPVDRIERQIGWMGHRQAKRPDAFLVAAIERDFDPPVAVQRDALAGRAGEPNGEA